ncbi:transcription factor VIP1 [Andrographis paniculata]|uniref:transcription factor VIP1 n=1 Tax=Andrographis paniculata TaxID=175694 RepID=UPI0021E988AF|nr:transcription factor VIP1 [Andrographis paniculata]
MEPEYAGKPLPADLDQMPDTPTRRGRHRRAHSETFFHFPDLDDFLIDDVVADLSFDRSQTPPSLLPNAPPPPPFPHQGKAAPAAAAPSSAHLRSLSMDADFFEGLALDAAAPAPEVGRRPRHRHSNSMDGYSSTTSSEVDSSAKKAMPADRLAELALIDPKRAKRILANRQSAARSKERKTRYTNELERKVQTLQSEATTLSAQITLLQRDTSGLTAENKELKLKLQAMEQQAHLRDALNDALRDELKWLKIAAGQVPSVNGNNRGLSSQFLSQSQPATNSYFSNHQGQQQQHRASPNNPSPTHSFPDFNHRAG